MSDERHPGTGRSNGAGRSNQPAATLERWLTEHRAAMLEVARRYEGHAIRADDIVQEAAVKALSLTDRVPAVKHPCQWLRTITRYAGLRAATRRKHRGEIWGKGLADPTVGLEREPRVVGNWEREGVLYDRLGIVTDAVRHLHPSQREVVRLKLDGKRDDEIAEALEISKATVRVRWHRGIKIPRAKESEEQKRMSHLPTSDEAGT
ncbi:MAG: sigma-70 family RNA polymerase sigma factor [Gemmatimonadota bacterium]|nr:sigma-70 family RNA polymerase sigma factor [Gemmatimonadota bacterium]MDE2865579.1 sigma-70 family RNA polymerase sigma factor [Gemmatimonadota bacterium]